MTDHPAHRPVLIDEVVRMLVPANKAGRVNTIVDCTLGLGGHAGAMLLAAGEDAQLIGIDVDEANLRRAKLNLSGFPGRVRLFRANFGDLSEVLAQADQPMVDVLLADLGVASTQLDDPQRGLSFMADGPLDMRLDDRQRQTAADLVNKLGERDLADLVYKYGEERYSRRIAKAIVTARRSARIETTAALAEIVTGALPAPVRHKRTGVHPATRTLQALRIAVNDEMASLDRLLQQLPDVLAQQGRAGIISFHSLEDRPVKQRFRELSAQGRAEVLTKKPISPSEQEIADNPRSRSAKLRVIERIST